MSRYARGAILLLLLLSSLVPVFVVAQPAGATVVPASVQTAPGSLVVFCIQTQDGGAYSYQWQKNGVNLAGQTNLCLTMTNVTIGDGGSYRATVSGGAFALVSEEAELVVGLNALPGADLFDNGTAITAVSNSVLGSSSGATRELDEPLHFGLSTSNSVWYRWRAPASGIVTFDTRGSTFDTVLAVYGGGLNRLTEIASDDDGGGFHTSQVSWNALAGVDYHVAIDGVTGETGTYACNWSLEITGARLPVITLKPRSQTALPGGSVTFSTAATDPRGVVNFQWFHNGVLIPGATSSNLTLVNIQSADLGQYRLAVMNSVGRVAYSAPVDLEIGPQADVQSKDKIAEVPVPTGGGGGRFLTASSTSGGTFSLSAGTIIQQRFFNGGTTDRCEPAHCGVPGGASRWFQLAPTSDGICTLDTGGSDVDTVLAVYLQNFSICTDLYEPLVDCNNDALGTCGQILSTNRPLDRSSRLSFFANAGMIYRAVVDTAGGIRGTNLHFNVHFASTSAVPASVVSVASGVTTNSLLEWRGSSVVLQVADSVASPTNSFQWMLNGRRIAGAGRDRLMLPFLDYSDAGRYSVTVQNGATRTLLPGVALLVFEPCRGSELDGSDSRTMQLLGTSPEAMRLQAGLSLNSTSSWQDVGPIRPTTLPIVWDSSPDPFRFYRVLRSPP